MKTFLKHLALVAFLFIGTLSASAQAGPPYYYPLLPSGPLNTPLYAAGGNTGASINYGYDTLLTPTSDTLKIATSHTYERIVVYVNHNLILVFDTTGDTAKYSNYPNGRATVWYKKKPYLYNHQLDETNYVFENGSTSNNYKVTVPWFNNGLVGDTIHVPKHVNATGAGGSFATATYIYPAGWVWKPYTTW